MPTKSVPTNQALYNRVKQQAKRKFKVYPSIYANAWLTREYKKRGGKYRVTKSNVNRRTSRRLPRKSNMSRKTQYRRKNSRKNVSKKPSRTPRQGLTRWFSEKWVDACQLPRKVPCGRKKASMRKYPYCRPSIRVNKNTPKTIYEIPKSTLASRCRRKRSNPMRKIR